MIIKFMDINSRPLQQSPRPPTISAPSYNERMFETMNDGVRWGGFSSILNLQTEMLENYFVV